MDYEARTCASAGELRIAVRNGVPGPGTLSGYAATFNNLSDPISGPRSTFRERIAPGAFSEGMRGDVIACVNHDPSLLLGRTSSGTLRLTEDARGLSFEADLPDTQLGRDLATQVARGDIRGMSFRFNVPSGGDHWAKVGGEWLRTLMRVAPLIDVSPTTFPAYPDTSVALRALIAQEEAEAEASLSEAKRIEESRRRRLRIAGI